jgi:hypothetical protein
LHGTGLQGEKNSCKQFAGKGMFLEKGSIFRDKRKNWDGFIFFERQLIPSGMVRPAKEL